MLGGLLCCAELHGEPPGPAAASRSAATQPAATQPATTASQPASDDLFSRARLTGNWWGLRDRLEARGVTVEATHDSTFFLNARGGRDTSHHSGYSADTTLTLDLDTTKMGLWQGGEICVIGEDRHGPSISNHVGDLMGVNNEEARDFVQVEEYWLRQELWPGHLWLKLGKMDAAKDFQVVEYGARFLNSSFGVIPNVPVPTYPDPALGVQLRAEPTDWLYAMAGVYDADGRGGSWGFDTAFHDEDHSVSLLEVGLKPSWCVAGRKLPGVYRAGVWYDSGEKELFSRPIRGRRQTPPTRRGDSGLYLAFDQLVWKENAEPDDTQGAGLFFQYGWARAECNLIHDYYGFGVEYTGLLPGRDKDVVGVGMAYANLSGRAQAWQGLYDEAAVESFYKVCITPWMTVAPDLQYVVNPGGEGRDALVLGMRLSISF